MNHSVFETYFRKRLADNPYIDEIMDMLEEKLKPVKRVTQKGETEISLEETLEHIELMEYRISTMTCIYQFGTQLDEYTLYDIAESIVKDSQETYDRNQSEYKVVGMECFDKPIVGQQIKKKRGKLSKRKFRNQMTMIVWSREGDKYIKVKLFRTGKAQMTGVRSERDGKGCVQYLINLLNHYKEELKLSIGDSELTWKDASWSIAMMNGDFDVKKKISREYLHSIVCPRYGIVSNLDADTYPGVIMKHTIGEKKVTVSVFSSGKVIITGANARSQIENCVRLVTFLCRGL